MILKKLTQGSISGTGTLTCSSRILGGVLISADGTNAATVIVRKDNSSGEAIFHLITKTPIFVTGPIANRDSSSADASQAIYYDISGTGASAQLYEWIT